MIKLNELKIVEWWRKTGNWAKDSIKKNIFSTFFISVITIITLCFSVESFKNFLKISSFTSPISFLIIIFGAVILTIVVLTSFLLLYLLSTILGYLIYLIIKPWIFVVSYETLLKTLMDEKGFEIPDADRIIKQKELNIKVSTTQNKEEEIN